MICSKNRASITLPDTVTSIGDSAFYCCEELTSITIPGRGTFRLSRWDKTHEIQSLLRK